jgi:hypothetical protein
MIRLTPADVGARVSVRARIVPAPPDGPGLTDTVGVLRRWAAGVLEIERRDGRCVRVAETDLVAAKTLPPPPYTASSRGERRRR